MLAAADISENVLTMVAAIVGIDAALDQMRRLVQADPGLHRVDQHRVSSSSQKAGVRQRLRAAENARLGRGAAPASRPAAGACRRATAPDPPAGAPASSQAGTKPTSSVSDRRAPASRRASRGATIANCAISGIATSPTICARVATEVAKARRATNQLLTAP